MKRAAFDATFWLDLGRMVGLAAIVLWMWLGGHDFVSLRPLLKGLVIVIFALNKRSQAHSNQLGLSRVQVTASRRSTSCNPDMTSSRHRFKEAKALGRP